MFWAVPNPAPFGGGVFVATAAPMMAAATATVISARTSSCCRHSRRNMRHAQRVTARRAGTPPFPVPAVGAGPAGLPRSAVPLLSLPPSRALRWLQEARGSGGLSPGQAESRRREAAARSDAAFGPAAAARRGPTPTACGSLGLSRAGEQRFGPGQWRRLVHDAPVAQEHHPVGPGGELRVVGNDN